MTDAISGETITYQYDSLNRMINASGTGDANGAWSQAFTYDGFGNLVAKAGSNAPNNITINVNPANNQLNSNNALFDSVGNLLQYGVGTPEQTYSYDIENRVTHVTASGVTTVYGYDTRNQRIYSGPQTVYCPGNFGNLYLYGIDGKKLAVMQVTYIYQNGCVFTTSVTKTNVWFAGRLLQAQDRLNSIGKYFPYGEDRTNPTPANPPNGQEKFATYTRDAESGLDYAYQRYYTSGLGRFLTPDPMSNSARLFAPQTWNRYSYAQSTPTNLIDRRGTCARNTYPRAPGRENGGRVRFVAASYHPGEEQDPVDGADSVCDAGGDTGGSGGATGDGGDPSQPWVGTIEGSGYTFSSDTNLISTDVTAPADPEADPTATVVDVAAQQDPVPLDPSPCITRTMLAPGGNANTVLASTTTAAKALTKSQMLANRAMGQSPVNANLIAQNTVMLALEASGAPFDFKNQPTGGAPNPQYDDFGNFNYGAVAASIELAEWYAQWAAGVASFNKYLSKGRLPPARFGRPWSGPPWGDNPQNQAMIAAGYNWYLNPCN